MRRPSLRSKPKQTITWEQFKEFATRSGRDLTHAFRVFRGERNSAALAAEFEQHFGFPMKDAALAGRKRATA